MYCMINNDVVNVDAFAVSYFWRVAHYGYYSCKYLWCQMSTKITGP